MRKALSTKTLDALKPDQRRYEVRDLYCPCFGLRVYPTGRKVFFAAYRYGARQRRINLGVYPRTGLAQARAKATDLLRQVDEGIDPASRRRQPSLIVEAVCADFIRQYAKPRNKGWRETERMLKREFISVFGQRDIRTIRRPEILEIVDAAIERSAHYQANRIIAVLRRLFSWAVERSIVEASPLAGMKMPTRERSRDRVLDDDELRRLFRACRADTYPFGPFVLMLLCTGQRRGELAQMEWEKINQTAMTWEIPAELSKKTASRMSCR